MKKEGKTIQDLFQIPFHSLKSPKDYIQLDKFYEALQSESDNGMIRRFKMQLLVWLTMTETGEFSEIGQLYRHLHFVADICHDGQLSKRSLFIRKIFGASARKSENQPGNSDQSCLSVNSSRV